MDRDSIKTSRDLANLLEEVGRTSRHMANLLEEAVELLRPASRTAFERHRHGF